MENEEIITPINYEENIKNNNAKEIVKTKEYTLENNNTVYKLKMTIEDNEKLLFQVNQINNISGYYYFKNYTFEEIKNVLNSNKENFRNIKEIFKFFDTIINQNNIKLIQESNKKITINLIEINNINPKQYHIPLEQKILSTKENIKILNDEISEMKTNKELINQIIKDNEYLRNENKQLLENQKLLLEQIKILTEKLNNNTQNNNLNKECPRCNGKGTVPQNLEWDSKAKNWSYLEKYEERPTVSGGNKYHYCYILVQCPLCKGNKFIDITKYTRCFNCQEICGYTKSKSFFGGTRYEFCKTCSGLGYV